MKYISLVIGMFSAILLSAGAIAIRSHDAYWLISGYSTMSEEKKRNVDIKKLGEFIANGLFVMSAMIAVAVLLTCFNHMVAAGIVFLFIVFFTIYVVVKAQSYDGNTREPDGTMKTRTKVLIGVIIGFTVMSITGVGMLLHFSSKSAEYFIQDGTMNIGGLYGEEIKLSDIISITIEEQIPEIQSKTNGSALGSNKKGYFRLKDIGQAKLFVNTQKPPFIFINAKSGLLIINTNEPETTKKLYEKLTEALVP